MSAQVDVDSTPDELVADNLPLVRAIVSRDFASATSASVDVDDLLQVGCLGLMEAARTFRPERGAFGVWASLHINAFICRELRLDRRRPEAGCSDKGLASVVDRDQDGPDLGIAAAVNDLPQPYRQIIIRSYGLDWRTPLGVRALARLRRCSSATICHRKAEALDELRDRLTA